MPNLTEIPATAERLALHGGPKTRTRSFPEWPIITADDERAVLAALRSGKWGIGGEHTTAFEEAFARAHGTRFGVAVSSGTSALRIALLAAGIQAGDEVIVPPYTFLATATAVVECNAVPIFVDVHPDTYNLDPDLIEAAITPRTRAIIPVHFAGLAADMELINAIAQRRGLLVVEDAAHAHGGRYKGRMLGSWATMGCFSFQSSKNLNSGEGGFITTDDEKLAIAARAVHSCGRMPGGAWYEHHIIAGNYRMTQFQAALLLSQMSRLEEQTRRRDANGRYLNAELAKIPGIRPMARPEGQELNPQHLYMFRYDAKAFGGVPRDVFFKALDAEGAPVRAGYPVPLHHQPLFADKAFGPYTAWRTTRPNLDYRSQRLPVAERACYEEACWISQTVMLGEREDMDDIVRAIRKVQAHAAELRP